MPKSCEILMQGGLNPKLRLEYYEELLSAIRDRYPQVQLHCLSATEIIYIAHLSKLSLEETLRRLRDAVGSTQYPGLEREILVDEVRDIISFAKIAPASGSTCTGLRTIWVCARRRL